MYMSKKIINLNGNIKSPFLSNSILSFANKSNHLENNIRKVIKKKKIYI